MAEPVPPPKKKRKPGVPTGNAGEYFVMGELLRRGFDAQLADRNTKGYDLLVGRPEDSALRKVQVKSVRVAPWYVRADDFAGELLDRVTVYVLVGALDGTNPVRYFIAKNLDLANSIHRPPVWVEKGERAAFMALRDVEQHENRWDVLSNAPPPYPATAT